MALTTLPTAALANDAVDNTKLNLADNYAFTGTVTGASDFEKITETNVTSDVSYVTFEDVFSSTYRNYKCYVIGVQPNSTGNQYGCSIQIKADGGWKTSANGYNIVRNRVYHNGGSTWTHNASGYRDLKANLTNGINNSGTGYSESATNIIIDILDPLNTYSRKGMVSVSYGGSDVGNTMIQQISWVWEGGGFSALEGFRFLFGAGSIARGRFILYGIKD